MPIVVNFGFAIKRIKSLFGAFARILKMEDSFEQNIFKPPATVRGMLELDRNAFTKQVDVPAVLVPVRSMQKFNKAFKREILKNRGTKLLDAVDGDSKITTKSKFITMKPDFDVVNLSQDKLGKMKELGIKPDIYRKKLDISYQHYKHQEILGAVLPEGLEATSGFEGIGHIIHVNLLEHQLPYKNIIGQVLLDKHKSTKTVVNKSSVIENTYRIFPMEIIAGEDNFMTKVVEYGQTYEFDFSKVFWNSRLQEEHRRILNAIPEGSTVFDVCAGVGPFSIPLSKKNCKVFANDLNGESIKWLRHNMKLNKTNLDAFNMDGRQFIREHLGKYARSTPSRTEKIYVIMNLPGMAIEFLDAFEGLMSSNDTELLGEQARDGNLRNKQTPTVHIFCYVFSSAEDKIDDVRDRAATFLEHRLPDEHIIRGVRTVAPGKEMFCLSFDCPKAVLLGPSLCDVTNEDQAGQPVEKKRKLAEISS